MRDQLHELLKKRVRQCVSHSRSSIHTCPKIEKKKESLSSRSGEIVKAQATGKVINVGREKDDVTPVEYKVHFKYLIKQKGVFYMEEEIEERTADFYKGVFVEDREKNPFKDIKKEEVSLDREIEEEERYEYEYDRIKAVQYAEKWWNSFNPAYKKFDVDCTNYISQCLHAGSVTIEVSPPRKRLVDEKRELELQLDSCEFNAVVSAKFKNGVKGSGSLQSRPAFNWRCHLL